MQPLDPLTILEQMHSARKRTLSLIDGLDQKQLMGPCIPTINPLLWEIGHTAYFYEFWVLRHHAGLAPIREDADQLYDSINIAHDDRWNLPLPSLAETLTYMQAVFDSVAEQLQGKTDPERDYLAQYAVFHEDMHTEAFTYTRQTLGYPAPKFGNAHTIETHTNTEKSNPCSGDVTIPAGTFQLGASPQSPFVFDNEKWAHPHKVDLFRISRGAVSNANYLRFVRTGGYLERRFWCDTGWRWRQTSKLTHPVYWRQQNGKWQSRHFDQWQDLSPHAALIHVSWYEAQAFCRWAERRLPTELEWEAAAAGQLDKPSQLSLDKRDFPWGDVNPANTSSTNTRLANLDGYALGTVDVGAYKQGSSAFGCRQMIGNVWEWTNTNFSPYPAFESDMYADYSQPLFGNTKVLRGGAWPTRSRMIRNTWRTYYGPNRNDVFAGFRTCAL